MKSRFSADVCPKRWDQVAGVAADVNNAPLPPIFQSEEHGAGDRGPGSGVRGPRTGDRGPRPGPGEIPPGWRSISAA